MDLALSFHIFDAIIILGVSFPVMYMGSRISVSKLRVTSVFLGSFLTLHGLYHLLAALNGVFSSDLLDFLSDGLLEPVSYLILLVVALLLFQMGRGK